MNTTNTQKHTPDSMNYPQQHERHSQPEKIKASRITPGRPWTVNRSGNRIMVDTRMETICQANGEANAALIAAAPELFEALKALLNTPPFPDDVMLLALATGLTSAQQEKFRPLVEQFRAAREQAKIALARAQGKARGE